MWDYSKIIFFKRNELAFPDPEGNIISNNNNNNFECENHLISIEFHESYAKDYINLNYINLSKNEIFKEIDTKHKYIKEFYIKYFLENPDESTNEVINNLSIRFKMAKEDELISIVLIS